jgi:hypothetical protein
MNGYPENRGAKLIRVFDKPRKINGIWDMGLGI